MKQMENNRLSSDYLYSFTKNFEALKNILKSGFRYSKNHEKIPYESYEQENFIVCFCDILPEQAGYHKSIYGSNALSFKKEWGIKKGISPVRYVHKSSPGCLSKYIQIKNDLRKALTDEGGVLGNFLALTTLIQAREKGYLTKDSFDDEIGNEALDNFIEGTNIRFQEKKEKVGSKYLTEIYNDWISPLITYLNKMVNELEARDAYMRIYSGDFRDIKEKILYDEREWRAVKIITIEEEAENPNIKKERDKLGHFPDSYNLMFEANDIYEILVENEEKKNELKKFINDQLPQFKSIIDSIKVID